MIQPKQVFLPLNECLDFCCKKCPKNQIDWDAVHHNSKTLDCNCLKVIDNHKRFLPKPHMPVYAYQRNVVPEGPDPTRPPKPPTTVHGPPEARSRGPPTPQPATTKPPTPTVPTEGGFKLSMGEGEFDQYDKREPHPKHNTTLDQCKAFCTDIRKKRGDLWNTLTYTRITETMHLCTCEKNSRGMFKRTHSFKNHFVWKWQE
jgi:hypothetical protein